MNTLISFLLGLAAGAYAAESIREVVPILKPAGGIEE